MTFLNFHQKSNKNAMVGIGDSLVILNESNKSLEVFRALVDDNFGQIWISKLIQVLFLEIKIQILNK